MFRTSKHVSSSKPSFRKLDPKTILYLSCIILKKWKILTIRKTTLWNESNSLELVLTHFPRKKKCFISSWLVWFDLTQPHKNSSYQKCIKRSMSLSLLNIYRFLTFMSTTIRVAWEHGARGVDISSKKSSLKCNWFRHNG